jgi:hypothetical protein
MPSLRTPPSGFGISTRFTGCGLQAPLSSCSRIASQCYLRYAGNSWTRMPSTSALPLLALTRANACLQFPRSQTSSSTVRQWPHFLSRASHSLKPRSSDRIRGLEESRTSRPIGVRCVRRPQDGTFVASRHKLVVESFHVLTWSSSQSGRRRIPSQRPSPQSLQGQGGDHATAQSLTKATTSRIGSFMCRARY